MIGGLLEAQSQQDVRDVKRLIMTWLGATERRRRDRGKRKRRGAKG